MSEKSSSYIFEQIVKDDDDIVGLVGYARYKTKKVKKIKQIKQKTGLDYVPSDNEALLEFQNNAVDHISEYRAAAKQWLDALSHKVYKIETDDFKDFAVEAFKEIQPKFWRGVGQSLVGAALFTVLAGLFVLGYYALK